MTEKLTGLLEEPLYEKFFRQHDLVRLRALWGHHDAVEALDQLRRLQLRSLGIEKGFLTELNNSVDPTGNFEKTIIDFEATDIWNEAIRYNPSSGRG